MEKTSEKRKSKQSDRGGMLEKKGKNRSNRIEVGIRRIFEWKSQNRNNDFNGMFEQTIINRKGQNSVDLKNTAAFEVPSAFKIVRRIITIVLVF